MAGAARGRLRCAQGRPRPTPTPNHHPPTPSPGSARVTVGGTEVAGWAFDSSNVLSWEGEAGCSAWLQFLALATGAGGRGV